MLAPATAWGYTDLLVMGIWSMVAEKIKRKIGEIEKITKIRGRRS
jgi:hypothetical protein